MYLWKHPQSEYWYAAGTGQGRVSLKTKDRETALQKLEDLRKLPTGGFLTNDFAIYHREKTGIASHDIIGFAWKHLKPVFGHLRHDQITREKCRDYIALRAAQGIRSATIARELSVLKSTINYSHKHSPAQFETPSLPPPRDRRLTKDEYRKLLNACDIPHIKLFVVLALATAGRSAAILDLTWDRVDFERGQIDLRVDGLIGKGRAIVPITDHARDCLLQAFEYRQSQHVIEYAGHRVKSIKRGFRRACQLAELTKVTPHAMRHTAASWMAEAGVPMTEISSFLGHRDSIITQRVYAKYSPTYLSKAALALAF